MLKKIVALTLCLILLCGTGLVANAESVEDSTNSTSSIGAIQPMYDYANLVSSTLSKSSGKALCNGQVIGYSGLTTKIKITLTLQKKTLLWWSTEEEWTTTVSSYQASLTKTQAVGSGKYRVKLAAVVYSGSNSENITVYSSTVEF